MKKIILAIVTLSAMFIMAACEPEKITDPGTLTIENIEVYYQETEVIVPVFSEPLAGSQPTYTFDGNDIRIDGNVITGLVANTETVVTATTKDHSTTFKVTVIYKLPLGQHATTGEGEDVFTLETEDVFVKSSADYGEAFFYDGDDALHGIRYMLRGTLSISEITEDGQAQILLRESTDKEVRFVFEADENEAGSYRVFSDYKNGEDYEGFSVLKTGLSNTINFNVMIYDGLAYLFISDTYVGNVSAADIGEAHIGFGGQGLTMTLSRLRADHNEGRMATYLAMAVSPFGNHAFTSAPSDPDVFVETEDNVYVKSLMGYQQTFYYQEGLPVAGTSFTFEGQVTMTNASDWAQFVLMVTEDTTNMSRYVFERMAGGTYQIFFDVQDDGVFKNFETVTTMTTNTLDFIIFFDEGNTHLVVDDVLIHSYEAGYDKAHIGLGGEKATLTLSNIFGETNADRLDDYIPAGYQLGEHFAGAADDADMFVKTSLTSFEKTNADYGQAFLSHNELLLEGLAYTFTGQVKVSEDVVGATAIILFQQDENNFTRFVLEVAPEGVKIFTDNMINGDFTGLQEILAPQANNVLDLVAVYNDGNSYLFLDNELLVSVTTEFGVTQLGFAGEKGTMSVAQIEFVDHADILAGIEGLSFGSHAYGAITHNNVFTLQEDGSFIKTSAAYQQTFLYDSLEAVAGMNFTISGTLINNGSANTTQATIVLQKDDANLRRIVLERWDNKYQVFTDKKVDNNFIGWQSLRGLNNIKELNFELAYAEGELTFLIDGTQVLKVNDDLGNVHLGFAGQVGEIVLKDLKILGGYQLGEHFAGAADDADMFVKTSLTSFNKTTTGYGQAFLSHNGVSLEGLTYTFSGQVGVSADTHGATSIILFQQDENNFTRFVLEAVPEGVKIFTDNKINGNFSGWQEILAPQANDVLDLVAVYDDGNVYLFLDKELLVNVTTSFGATQLGFAGEKGTMSVAQIDFVDNASILDNIAGFSFGPHAYGASADNNVFILQEDGTYKKTTTAYQQTFLYDTLEAVAGMNFTVSGTIVNDSTNNSAQSIIVLQKDDANLRRVIVERYSGKFQVFTDKKINDNFSGWELLRGLNDNNTLNFELVYIDGLLTFSIEGVEVLSINDNLGNVHFGFAGVGGEIILSDLVVTIG